MASGISEIGLPAAVQSAPGIAFVPDDATLVTQYLLPRLRGVAVPLSGVFIHDDPYSAEPWALLHRHGLGDTAYFFAKKKTGSGKRCSRAAGGGSWRGQKRWTRSAETPGKEMVQWEQYMMTFTMAGEKKSRGWIMHQYDVISPAVQSADPVVLCRVSLTAQSRSRRRRQGVEEDSSPPAKAPRACMDASPSTPMRMDACPSTPVCMDAFASAPVAADAEDLSWEQIYATCGDTTIATGAGSSSLEDSTWGQIYADADEFLAAIPTVTAAAPDDLSWDSCTLEELLGPQVL